MRDRKLFPIEQMLTLPIQSLKIQYRFLTSETNIYIFIECN